MSLSKLYEIIITMIRNLQGDQFKAHSKGSYSFKPQKEQLKSVDIFLNSTDKQSGTNADATFKVELPTEFTTQRLSVCLKNFIPVYPTNTDECIIHVNLIGIENPYSYTSCNQSTHRTLGTFPIGSGFSSAKEYPPTSLSSNLVTTLSNQAYGNGIYTLSQTTSHSQGQLWKAFNKEKYTSNVAQSSSFTYCNQTGVYISALSNNTTMSGTQYFGEHFTIQLPQSITATAYEIYPSTNGWRYGAPTNFVFGGSTDGTTWTLLDAESNFSYTDCNPRMFTINNSNPYSYYRILGRLVGNSNESNFRNSMAINEFVIWGFNSNNSQYPPKRYSQCNLNCDIVTCDNTLFNRPVTLQLRALNGVNLAMCDWSAELTVSELK
jgi:hypothetical protein